MKNINKKDIFRVFISITIVSVLLLGAVYIVNYEPKREETLIDNQFTSELVSTDPKVSAANFIYANGNIGVITEDVNENTLVNGEAEYKAIQRRYEALELVKTALVPGSPLVNSAQESFIKNLLGKYDTPIFYEIKNVVVSNPENAGKLEVHSETGSTVYDYVEVYASFDSYRVWYQWGRDTDWDGNVLEVENKEHFENIKVSLVKSGDLWFIHDIENAEHKINSRFATWKGVGVESYSENDEIRREILTISQ